MSDSKSKEEVLSAEEIDALVERASEPGFDDGEFRTHDFSGGETVAMTKWTELLSTLEKHSEALEGVMSSEYGLKTTLIAKPIEYGVVGELIAGFPDRLCLISTVAEPFDGEVHLLLEGDLLTFLVNHYFGGGSLPVPQMSKRVTPSEQRIGERVSKNFYRVMSEVWADRLPIAFGDLFVDITPDRFSMLPKAAGFAVLPFELSFGSEERFILKLLIPFDALEANATAFVPTITKEMMDERPSDWEPNIKAALPEVSVEVRGELCELNATLRTLLQMQVGTTIPISEPSVVRLFLENEVVAEGGYGAFDGFKAFQFNRFRENK
jgi:flagellar motor switch protein FliM